MIKIESGIPAPTSNTRTFVARYPWRDLEVSQSFLVTDVKFKTMQAGASLAGKRLNRKFVARIVDGGVRVWRTA